MTTTYLRRQQALLRYLLAFTTVLILAAPAQAQPKTEDELAIREPCMRWMSFYWRSISEMQRVGQPL